LTRPALAWPVWLAFGSCLGSFLNVCIYRMPKEQSIVWPASRCPHCEKPIAWFDNIPVVSWLLLRARCRNCRKPILWRYPVVELLTGLMTVATFARFGVGPVGLIYVAFVCALIVVSFIDLEFQIIPDEISLGGLVVALVLSLLVPQLHGTDARLVGVGRAVIGMLVGGGLLYGTGMLGDFLFKKESMGGGDIKLLAMAGAVLGWKAVLLTFFLAPILALPPGLVILLTKKEHVIPYGPFLSLALVVSLFFGALVLRVTGLEDSIQLITDYYRYSH